MIILGISGRKNSGKDTVTDIIKQSLIKWNVPLEFVHMAFADALYREVAWYVHFIRNGCEMPDEVQMQDTVDFIKNNKKHFRLILQGWGTDYTRELVCQTYWIDRMVDKLFMIHNKTFIVISDVRFENEFQLFLKHEYPVWRLMRASDDDVHASENELSSLDTRFSINISNHGTVEELKFKVARCLRALLTAKGFEAS